MEPALFRLEGQTSDLEELRSQFPDGDPRVFKEGDFFYLEAALASGVEPVAPEAVSAAEAVLARMNGVMLLQNGLYQPVRVHGASYRGAVSGTLRTRASMQAAGEVRAFGAATANVVRADGTVERPAAGPTAGQLALGEMASSVALSDAFFIYGAVPHDWRGLSMVWDAIAHGQGKPKAAEEAFSGHLRRIKDFTATANSYKAIGLAARHGPDKAGVEKPRMELAEAQELIRDLLNAWLERERSKPP